MKLVAVDWDGKAVWVSEDGDQAHVYNLRDQFKLLDRLTDPTLVVLESTFESYDPDRRKRTIDEYAAAGHDLRTISPRRTSWWRIARGIEKSNEADAAAIFGIASTTRAHLKVPSPSIPKDDDWAQLRAEAEHEIMVLRRSGRKDDFAKRLVKQLPRFKNLPDVRQAALGGASGYSLVLVAATGVAAAFTDTVKDFERLAGLYDNGKNSQFRSDFYHWGWKPRLVKEPVPGEVTATGRPKMRIKIFEDGRPRGRDGLTLSDYRRELRWLYRQLKELEVVA